MTIQQERELGEKVLEAVKARWPIIQDVSVNVYISGIGKRILQSLDPQPFDYQFFVLNTPELNAFAVPGGKVFVNSGLITAMDTEDELASVMSHEIGHVVARHISKRQEQGTKISLAALGTMLAGILLGGKAAGAIATTTVAATETAFLKYSREDEEEADYLGSKFMERAGYDRHGMLTMLKKMRRITGPAGSDPPAYLLTHPAVEERIGELEIQMARYPSATEKSKPVGNLQRIQTKLVVAEKDVSSSVAYFQNWLKRKPDDPEAFLGLGMAQKRMGGMDRAIENLTQAASLAPNDGEIQRELGAAYLLKGDLGEGRKYLEKAEKLTPSDGVTHFYLGRVYLEQSLADQALPQLLRAKELNPNLPDLYYHLAQAYGAKNLLGPAYLNFGYHYKAAGDRKQL